MIFNPVRFCMVFIGLQILLILVSVAAEAFFQVSLSSSVSGIAPTLVAAMFEGQKRAQATKLAPAGGAMWKAAVVMTALVWAISIVAIIGFVMFDPSVLDVVASLDVVGWVVAILIVTLLSLLVARFGYGLGVKSEMKRLDAGAK